MIITCPGCRTQFRIAPASLGADGRTVRCSSCSERWFAEPFLDPPPEPPPACERACPRGVANPRGRLTSWLAAALAVLLLAALIAGRNEIAARLPAAVPLYQRLGLSLELPLGMEFRGLASEQRVDEGRPVLVVTGEISNSSSQQREVPPIRVALLDAERRELDFGLFDPPQPALGPGGEAGSRCSWRRRPRRATSRSRSAWSPADRKPWRRWRWRCWKRRRRRQRARCRWAPSCWPRTARCWRATTTGSRSAAIPPPMPSCW